MHDLARFIGMPLRDIPTPSVIIERGRLHRNVQKMARTISGFGVSLRPHWKTSKCIEVAELQLAAGAVGFTAATANEVDALITNGITDVFWAYAPVGEHRINQAIDAARQGNLIVGTDSVSAIEPLADAASTAGLTIKFRLEVDTGMGRTGVYPRDAVEVARRLHQIPGIALEGVYTHEGQVQGIGNDAHAREIAGRAAGGLLVRTAEEIRSAGIRVETVSVGSTAGAWSAPEVPGVTEARPGTYVYGDENQIAIGTLDEEDSAMTVLSRVVSVERPDVVLVDAGSKAMSSDGSLHGDGRYGTTVSDVLLADGGLLVSTNEEHGFLKTPVTLAVGDLVRVRPNHACGVSNMHSHIFIVDDGLVVGAWPIRGRH